MADRTGNPLKLDAAETMCSMFGGTESSSSKDIPIRVAIVDDHRAMLAGLTAWLNAMASEVQVVITTTSLPDLLEHPAFPVDVVLLDLDLGDGLPNAIKIATLLSTGAQVIVVSTFADPPHVREAIGAGAVGYVPKTEPPDEILAAIRAAAVGKSHVTPTLAEMLLPDQQMTSERSCVPKLSEQETRALLLYTSGLPMKTVARRMGVSYDTAKGYIDRVREKYALAGREARTKVDLQRRAIQDGLMSAD